MIEWPKTREWLEQNNYSFERRCRCRGATCTTTIEFWRTPSGRFLPLEQTFKTDPNTLVPHWNFCPDEKSFRAKPAEEKSPRLTKQQKAVAERQEKIAQRSLF